MCWRGVDHRSRIGPHSRHSEATEPDHTAGITRAGEPHRTGPDSTVLSSDHPSHLRRSSNPLGSDPKRSSTPHLSKGRSRMSLSNHPYEGPTQGATIAERPDEGP